MAGKWKLIILIIAAIAILAGIFIWRKFYFKQIQQPPAPSVADEESKSLGEKISEEIQNPAGKIPEFNPYGTKTNPFEEAKTNPFKNIYQNPFQ